MYAYCGNNPISRVDPYGNSFRDLLDDFEEWIRDRKEKAQKNKGTMAKGFTVAGAAGGSMSFSLGYTIDKQGNYGFIFTPSAGGGTPSLSAGMYETYTNAPTIFNQKGMGTAIGGSASISGLSVGADYNMLIDRESHEVYHGVTSVVGIGHNAVLLEMHGEVGYSTVIGFNKYDVALEVISWIESVLGEE